jgi:hypothetical protein
MKNAMHRLASLVALGALLASAPVSRARLYCRYTGIEIADCEEQRVPEHAVVQVAGCCERRVLPVLGPARTAGTDPSVASPIPLAAVVAASVIRRPVYERARHESPVRAAGPPLFLFQRALLI